MQPKQDDPSDVTLVLKEGKEIRATRNELSAASDFFCSLLNSDMRENREGIIRLEHITGTVMRDVLKFIRFGRAVITRENATFHLLEAADYLLLSSLKTIVGGFLERELWPLNYVSTYYYAEKYQCKDLVVASRKLIISNFAAVAQSQEFLNLESQQVEQWISSDEIAVSSEEEVFKIILQWIEQNKSERKRKFEELFRHVRLPHLSRDYLGRHVVTNDMVKENPSCLRLVEEALKGIYCESGNCPQSPRKWSQTHIVVFTGKETFCYQPEEDKWYRLADAPFYENESFEMSKFEGKLYVFPKLPRFQSTSAAGEIYDPTLNRWAELDSTEFPDKITKSGVAVVGQEMYSVDTGHFLNYNGFNKQLYWRSESFISKYIFELNYWKVVSSKIPLHYGACAVATDNYLYVLGGYLLKRHSETVHVATPITNAKRFNIVNERWELVSEMNVPRSNACGIATHGKIFIAGGITSSHDVAAGVAKSSRVVKTSEIIRTKTCEVYNVETQEWQLIASLNAPRSGGNLVCFKETLYVVGGVQSGVGDEAGYSLALTVESYDFQKKKWRHKTKIPMDRVLSRTSQKVVRACTLHFSVGVLGDPINSTPTGMGLMASLKRALNRR